MPHRIALEGALGLFTAPDPEYQPLDQPTHPDAQAFLGVWRERAKNGDLVIGTDIPSRPFARFLSNLMIVEPVEDGRDCRIRLAGTLLRQRYGREVSGERFSALFSGTTFAGNLSRMQTVRETGTPLILAGSVAREEKLPLCFDTVVLRARAPKSDALWNVIGVFPHTEK